MDLFNLAANLLGSVAPTVVSALAGKEAGAMVATLSGVLLGHPNGTEAQIAKALSSATPEQLAEIKRIESVERIKIAEIEKDDRVDARELQVASLTSNDWVVRRFLYQFSWFWAAMCSVYFFCVTFLPMPPGGKDFALTILGFLLGTAIGAVVNFWYGKSSE